LVNAGLLTFSNPQNVPAPAIASTKESMPVVEDDSNLRENAICDYRTAVLLEPVKLTTLVLVKYGDDGSFYEIYSHSACRANPRVVDYLYYSQGSQCKQCGVRFAEMKLGRQKMDDHLDMHLRQNSKVDQGDKVVVTVAVGILGLR
jgi:pre-mRNA cleavage complex 2 protein Pcf11